MIKRLFDELEITTHSPCRSHVGLALRRDGRKVDRPPTNEIRKSEARWRPKGDDVLTR
jgi:hypothetical protein